MANVFLTNIDESVANSLKSVLAIQKHRIENKPLDTPVDDFLEADIVFVGADDRRYLSLLQAVRQLRPWLPFVAVTAIPNTSAWLTALEAGATDYCSVPFEPIAINRLMESFVPSARGRTSYSTAASHNYAR